MDLLDMSDGPSSSFHDANKLPGTGGVSVTISLEVFNVLMAEVELMSATPPGSRVLSCEGDAIFPQRPSQDLLYFSLLHFQKY